MTAQQSSTHWRNGAADWRIGAASGLRAARRVTLLAGLVLALGSCAVPSIVPTFDNPFSSSSGPGPTRQIGPETLVSPDGRCSDVPPEGAPGGSGIGLDMTECEVVRRAGPPERVDIATNERGERTVVLTYLRGERPGIYRFVAGRLTVIERAPEPPAPPPKKKTVVTKKKKALPPTTRSAPPPGPQNAPPPASVWPAPPQNAPPPASVWPPPPQR